MTRYAESTSVSVDRSRAEIEKILSRYGADAFSYGYNSERARVMFRAHDRHVQFDLPFPTQSDVARTPTGLRRTGAALDKALEQSFRQRWRALALVIKAKLEAVEAGIVTFENEFLAHTLLPNGQTVGEWAEPQLEESYASATMPAVMPGGQPQLTETTS